MLSKSTSSSLQGIEQSHIQALTALIQANDRVNPLDPVSEAWRHEAYKISVQKKAIEDEATHQVRIATHKIDAIQAASWSAVNIALDREMANISHKISTALMRLELRLDRLETLFDDRKFYQDRKYQVIKLENTRLERESLKLKEEISDSEKLRAANLELRKILAEKIKDEKKTEELESRDSHSIGKSEIGHLLAELKDLEAEARRLDFRSK